MSRYSWTIEFLFTTKRQSRKSSVIECVRKAPTPKTINYIGSETSKFKGCDFNKIELYTVGFCEVSE